MASSSATAIAPKPLVTIDGSHGEGGGQILRNAAALAVVTNTPLRVHSIRAGRAPKPGLRPQHLHGLELVAALSGFELRGGVVGSSEVTLMPPTESKKKEEEGTNKSKTIRVDPRTAASTLLMMQTALPCLLLLPSSLGSCPSSSSSPPTTTTTLELFGGTDASAAPPADYARLVLLPTLRRAFAARPVDPPPPSCPPLFQVDLQVRRRGFFPRGRGLVSLTVQSLRRGETLPPIVLERKKNRNGSERVSVEVSAFSAGTGVPEAAAVAAADACVAALLRDSSLSRERISVSVSRLRSPEEAFGDGGGVIAVAKVAGGEGSDDVLLLGSALPLSPPPKGSNNKKQKTAATATSTSSYSPAPSSPEEVGARVGADLARDLFSSSSGKAAATDRWLQDQLIIFMALAKGTSRVETCSPLTEHTRSAIAVAEALTCARFRVVEGEAGGGGEGGEGERGGTSCVIECEGAGVEAR